MMLGDLGARVIKVEAPGHGDDTRGWGPPFVGEPGRPRSRRTSSRTNRNKESIALDLKDEADRTCCSRLVDRADVLVENFRTGVLERLGLGIEALQRAQPAAGRAVDHRVRPRRARGRPRRLRPDRAGRGRPDVADRLRSRRPAAGRRPDRRPAGRACTAPTACSPRCTSGTAPASAPSCGPRCSRPSSACTPSRAPAGPSPARSAARRATTTRRSRRTGCSTAATARCRSRSAARGCGGGSARASASTRPPTGWPPTPSGSANRERVIEVVEQAFADWDAEPLLARLAEVGVPAGKVRTLDEVYEWDQTASQGLLVDVEHPTLGGRHPARARRCASSTPTGAEVTRARPRRAADCSTSTPTRSAPGWRRRGMSTSGP